MSTRPLTVAPSSGSRIFTAGGVPPPPGAVAGREKPITITATAHRVVPTSPCLTRTTLVCARPVGVFWRLEGFCRCTYRLSGKGGRQREDAPAQRQATPYEHTLKYPRLDEATCEERRGFSLGLSPLPSWSSSPSHSPSVFRRARARTRPTRRSSSRATRTSPPPTGG